MRSVFFLFFFAIFSTPIIAGDECYTPLEAQAEQGVRIQSELMVIGLNCQHIATSQGQNLYAAYRNFSNNHSSVFNQYDEILINHYGNEAALHTIRTNFSNKISGDVANMRPDKFCAKYASRIAAVRLMDDDTLRRWAATPYAGYPPTKPLCDLNVARK